MKLHFLSLMGAAIFATGSASTSYGDQLNYSDSVNFKFIEIMNIQ